MFVAAALGGYVHWKRVVVNGQPFYYQLYFEPAVMIGCGKGFVVARPQVPEMVPFLLRQSDTFDCGSIRSDAPLGTDDMFQQGSWTYLMWAAGLTWRIFGVAWSALGPLFGLLFGLSVAAAYAVFRIGMGRVLSLAGALIIGFSPLHLKYLTALRDYAKAPFMLAAFFLMALFVVQRPRWRPALATAAAYGAVSGVGYGFRTDFLAFVPPFVVAAFLFLDGGLRRNIPLKAAASVAAVAGFVIAAWPVFSSLDQSRPGCQWHVIMTGLARQFDEPLGIVPAPYEVNREYLDEYAHTTVTSYAARRHPGIGPLPYCETGHGEATREFLVDVISRFPADIVARAYGSVLRIADLPWIGPEVADEAREGEPNFNVGRRRGLPVLLGAATALTVADVRLGLFFVFFTVYFGGLPGLQFDPRHFFHLEILTWFSGGIVAQTIWRARRALPSMKAVVRGATLVGGSVSALALLLWVVRLYQQPATRTLLNGYVSAPRDAISAGAPIRVSPRTTPETADFVAVDVNQSRCSNGTAIAFRYDDSRRAYSRVFHVPRDEMSGLTQIFMPIYDRFDRLDVIDAPPGCVDGIYRVRDPSRFTLLLEVVLRPGWRRAPLYQELTSS